MAVYTLTCSGTVCGGTNVLGVLELPDDHPDPAAAAWGHLCDVCRAAWQEAIAADAAAAADPRHPRPPAHPRDLAPIGPPRPPARHTGPPGLPGGPHGR